MKVHEIKNKYLMYGSQPWPHDGSTCTDPSHNHHQHEEDDPMAHSRVEVIGVEAETPQSFTLRYQGSEQVCPTSPSS